MSARRVTQRVFNEVCELLADGLSLRAICDREGIPDRRNIMRAINANEAWQHQYAEARKLGLEAWADDIVYAATTQQLGTRTTTRGKGRKRTTETVTGDTVERSRLEVDAKKWVLSKLVPKKFGDRLNVDHGVQASLADLVMQSMQEPPSAPPAHEPATDAGGS